MDSKDHLGIGLSKATRPTGNYKNPYILLKRYKIFTEKNAGRHVIKRRKNYCDGGCLQRIQ